MPYIELFNKTHFTSCYTRKKPSSLTSVVIDHYWESDYSSVKRTPFAETFIPSPGFSIAINLGTPYRLVMDEVLYYLSRDAYHPTNRSYKRIHSAGNKIFGIQFKVDPVIILGKEGTRALPLPLIPVEELFEESLLMDLKKAIDLQSRIIIIEEFFSKIISHSNRQFESEIVGRVLKEMADGAGKISLEEILRLQPISSRIIQRYFQEMLSMEPSRCWRIIRFRHALRHYLLTDHIIETEQKFYFDSGFFLDDIKEFTGKSIEENFQLKKYSL